MLQYWVVAIIAMAIAAFVWSRIFGKAGWSKWMGLLMVVPIVNLLMLAGMLYLLVQLRRKVSARKPPPDGTTTEYLTPAVPLTVAVPEKTAVFSFW
jgi:hypothetical protein